MRAGRFTSRLELAHLIARLTDFGGQIVWDTRQPDGQPRRKLDTSRAGDCEAGMQRTVEWHRAQLD